MINYSKKVLFASLTLALTLVLLGSCAPQADKVPEVQTSLSREIKEIRPGILEGYLLPEQMPNSLLLLPPPPEEGSAAWAIDAELHFPEATEAAKAEILLLRNK